MAAPPTRYPMSVLEAVDLSKVYDLPSGRVTALEHFSCQFAAGAITAVVGPSGSGKSTLLNLLAGFDVPSSGKVYLQGREISRLTDRERQTCVCKRLGLCFSHTT